MSHSHESISSLVEKDILQKYGHPLTAKELGRTLGEDIYMELPLIPKIFKLIVPEK